jgi:hypothetical protein
VWIDGGLHATEVLGAQQLIETIYRLNSKTDPETMRILNDDIILCTLINPDGMELVSNWYMREPDEKKRSTGGIPRLYQKYIGHDNNRDFYMATQAESVNANKMMYREWFPAIMYNHHQTGPAGAVLFAPPFRDPFNYHYDPLVILGIDTVGSAIHTRLAAEGKPGAVMRSATNYSTWFNGGIRTTSYFHNQIGILTETIGNPTPVEIPFVLDMQLPRADVPNPIAPRTFYFREAIEYSVTNNWAILDIASKRREDFLFNMYKMGKNSIDKGQRDHWTIHPKRIEAARAAIESARPSAGAGRVEEGGGRGGFGRGGAPIAIFNSVLRDPKERDPRGFILPADQPDFLTATKFINTLIKAGVVAHRATAPFTVGGKQYPAGSFVVKAAQAFRAHVMDMFEPQDHPDDIPYPGGPPRPPYDVTGYNIAYSMGIKFDRILEGVDGPFEPVTDLVAVTPGKIGPAVSETQTTGYLLSHEVNDAFVAVNRLLKANEEVYWLKSPWMVDGKTVPTGAMFIPAKPSTLPILQKLAADKGLSFATVGSRPADMLKLKPVRIGLWDQYGGSMPSGWTRWIFEQYEFPFEVVYPAMLDAGGLNAKYDVLVFVDGAIPAADGASSGGGFGGAQPAAAAIPAEFRGSLGRVTVAKTVPELRKFVENGGTVLTIGSSTALGHHLGLPIRNALVERIAGGVERPLTREKFYIPGTLLEARIDPTHPLAYGMEENAMVMWDESPAFRLQAEAVLKGVKPVAWFDNPTPLRSGWAWGQQYLDQAVAIVHAPLGKGHVVLFGPEVLWRAQPHGTFKLFFNGIYFGGATSGTAGLRATEQP